MAGLFLLVALFSSTAGQSGAQQPPANPPADGTLEQRVQQRKQERAVSVDQKEQSRLSSRCVKAQSELRSIQQKAASIAEDRAKTYHKIDAELWIIIGQLKLAEKETSKLEQKRSQLAQKIAAFRTTGNNYRQALDDTVLINCQADVLGFKAMLDTTRIYHKQWHELTINIKNLITNDVKTVLSAHVKDLQGTQSQGGI